MKNHLLATTVLTAAVSLLPAFGFVTDANAQDINVVLPDASNGYSYFHEPEITGPASWFNVDVAGANWFPNDMINIRAHPDSDSAVEVNVRAFSDSADDIDEILETVESLSGADGLISSDEIADILSNEVVEDGDVTHAFLARYVDQGDGAPLTPRELVNGLLAEYFVAELADLSAPQVSFDDARRVLLGRFERAEVGDAIIREAFRSDVSTAGLPGLSREIFANYALDVTGEEYFTENLLFAHLSNAGADGPLTANQLNPMIDTFFRGLNAGDIPASELQAMLSQAFALADSDNDGEATAEAVIAQAVPLIAENFGTPDDDFITLERAIWDYPSEVFDAELLQTSLEGLTQDSNGEVAVADVVDVYRDLALGGHVDLDAFEGFVSYEVLARLQSAANSDAGVTPEQARSILAAAIEGSDVEVSEETFDIYMSVLEGLADENGLVNILAVQGAGSGFSAVAELGDLAGPAKTFTVAEFLEVSDHNFPLSDEAEAAFIQAMGGPDVILGASNEDQMADAGATLFGSFDFDEFVDDVYVQISGISVENEYNSVAINSNVGMDVGHSGILASANGSVNITNAGKIEFGASGMPDPEGRAPLPVGIYALATDGIEIENTAELKANAQAAAFGSVGVLAINEGDGDVAIQNTGRISASVGIAAGNADGSVQINNSGNIKSVGSLDAFVILNDEYPSENMSITSAGLIGIASASWQVGSHGDLYDFEGTAEQTRMAQIDNSGDITITNDDGLGILAAGDDGAIVNNSGDVRVEGEDALGLIAMSSDGLARVVNTGLVTVDGKASVFAIGKTAELVNDGTIQVARNWSSPDNWNPAAGVGGFDSATAINNGSITASGAYMNGLFTRTEAADGTANILNTGQVQTDGVEGHGISSEGANVIIVNGENATLQTAGVSAQGIIVEAEGDVNIQNAGTVATTGAQAGAVDVYAGGKTTIANSGTLRSANHDGVSLSGLAIDENGEPVTTASQPVFGTGSLINSGTISGGVNSIGVSASNFADFTLQNMADGTIEGEQLGATFQDIGALVISNAGLINGLDAETAETALNNSGRIAGRLNLSAAQIEINNQGSISGGGEIDAQDVSLINAGTLEGTFDFVGDNALDLQMNAGAVFDDAVFNAGAGEDGFSLAGSDVGTNTIAENQFTGFETATFGGGNWSVDGDLSIDGATSITAGSVRLSDEASLTSDVLTIASAARFGGGGRIVGDVVNNGLIVLSANDNLTVLGNVSNNADSNVTFALGGTDGNPHSSITIEGGSFTYADADVLDINVYSGVALGQTPFEIVSASGGVDNLALSDDAIKTQVSDNAAAYEFVSFVQDNSLFVEATATIAAAVTQYDESLATQATAVEKLVTSGHDDGLTEALNGMDQAELTQTVRTLTASNESSNATTLVKTPAANTTNLLAPRISDRLSGGIPLTNADTLSAYGAQRKVSPISSLLLGYGQDGNQITAAMDKDGLTEAWAQFYVGETSFNTTTSTNYGSSFGADRLLADGFLVGGGVAVSLSDASAGASSSKSETFGATAYAAKAWENGTQLLGSVGFYRTGVESDRLVLGTTNSAEFNIDTWTADIMLSKNYMVGGVTLTPNVGLRYAHISTDGYTETGGIAPLSVAGTTRQSLEAVGGFTAAYAMQTEAGVFSPNISGGLSYEMLDTGVTGQATFLGGNPFDLAAMELDRLKGNVGVGFTATMNNGITVDAGYNGVFSKDYEDHLVRTKIKMKF